MEEKEKVKNDISFLFADFLLHFTGVRRLVVVEAGSKRVEGIISLSDVFRFLLG